MPRAPLLTAGPQILRGVPLRGDDLEDRFQDAPQVAGEVGLELIGHPCAATAGLWVLPGGPGVAGGGGEALTHLRCRRRGCAACPWCCCSASAAPTSGHPAGPRATALGYFWGAGGCTGGGDGYPWGGTKNWAPLSPHADPHVPVCAGAFHSIGGAQPPRAGVGQGGGVGGFQETPWSRGARSGHGRPPGRRGGRTAGILGFGCAQAPLQQAELLRRQHPQQVPAARGQGQPRVTSPLPPRGGTRVPPSPFLPPYLIFFRRL